MRYMTVLEAARLWDISERRVRLLCSTGRIDGAVRKGWAWSIPEQAKPGDARALRHLKNRGLRTGSQSFQLLDNRKAEADKLTAGKDVEIVALIDNQMDALLLNSMLCIQDFSITPEECSLILGGMVIPRLSLSDHLAVLNYREAITLLRTMVRSGRRPSKRNAAELQKVLVHHRGSSGELSYRSESAEGEQKPRILEDRSITIDEQVEVLYTQYEGEWRWLHPVVSSTFLLVELTRIHPYTMDGSALAFLMAVFHLMTAGYQPLLISPGMADKLDEAIVHSYRRGDCHSAVSLVNDFAIQGFDACIKLLLGF
jgi:hypothetical protein